MLFSQFRDGAIGQVLPAGQAGGRLAGSLLGRVLTGSGERRVRLRTLTLIRWIAIIGQAFTVALVHFSLEFRLPLGPMLGAIGLSALINLVLSGFAATTRLTERSAALLLGYDILQLAFLLGLTGGLQNPFSVLLIVPVTLSATTLSLRTTIVLCLFVVGAATVLALVPSDLPWRPGGFELPPLYVAGWSRPTPGGSPTRRGASRMRSRRPRWRSPASSSFRRWAGLPRPPRTSSAARSRRSR
ncbi:MAG: two-component sensor histidine kinase [Geminicoccaceae bacterium]|nr:two-component sensor histidine kinase [Geminicoccaceae bacterium]